MSTGVRPQLDDRLRQHIERWQELGASDDQMRALISEYERENSVSRETPEPAEKPSVMQSVLNMTPVGKAMTMLRQVYPKGSEAGAALNAANSAAFGFGDEAVGMVAGEGARDTMRRKINELPTAAKVFSGVAGGAVPMALTGGAAAPTTLGRAIAQTAGKGALMGAAYGAGNAEGGLAERAKGAAVGGAVTGALAGGVQGGAGLVQLAMQHLRRGPQEFATTALQKALEQGGKSADDIEAAARAAEASGKPTMMVDLLGKPGAKLARNASAFETKGGENLASALEGRMIDQPARIADDIATAGGIPKLNTRDAIDKLAAVRSEAAKPLYDAVRDVPVQNTRLGQIFALKDIQKAYAKAQTVAERRAAVGMGEPLPAIEELVFTPGTAVVRAGEIAQGRPSLTVGTLDQVKRALDDILYVSKRSPLDAGGMGPTELRSLQDVRNALVAIADEATVIPGTQRSLYAEARQAFEGPTRLMEQFDEFGKQFFRMKASDVQRELAALGPGERQAAQASALEELTVRLGKTTEGRDATRMLQSPEMKLKMQALLGDEGFANWLTRFQQEAGFGQVRNVANVGSRTTPMAVGAEEIAGDLGPAAAQAMMSGNFSPLLGAAMRQRWGARMRGIGSERADALSTRLGAGQGGLDEILQEVQRIRAGVPKPGVTPISGAVAQLLRGR